MARADRAEDLVGYSAENMKPAGGPVKQVRKPGTLSDVPGRGPDLVIVRGETGKTMEQVVEEEHPELEPELDDQARKKMDDDLADLVAENGVEDLKKALDEQGIDVLELDRHGLPIFTHDIRTDSINYQRLIDYAQSEGFLLSDISNSALVASEGKKKNRIDLREGLASTAAKEKLKSGVRLATDVITNKKDKDFVQGLFRRHPNLLHDLLTADQALDKTEVKLFPSGGKKPARVVVSGESDGEPVSISLSLDQWRLCLKAENTPVLLPNIKAKEGGELVRTFEGSPPVLEVRREGQVVETKMIDIVEPTAEEAETLANWQLAFDSLSVGGLRSTVSKFEIMRRVKKK